MTAKSWKHWSIEDLVVMRREYSHGLRLVRIAEGRLVAHAGRPISGVKQRLVLDQESQHF
jgi:hypothetical protein